MNAADYFVPTLTQGERRVMADLRFLAWWIVVNLPEMGTLAEEAGLG